MKILNVGSFWCFTGGDGERLCSPTFPVSPEAPAGPRTLVLLPTGQHDSLFLLQECCKTLLTLFILCAYNRSVDRYGSDVLSSFCPASSCELILVISLSHRCLWRSSSGISSTVDFQVRP